MFLYYLRLAVKSLRATPGLTAVTLLAIALGIAVPTASLSIRHVFAQDPVPEKSDRLFNVRVESWDANSDFFGPAGEPPKHIAYRDMIGLRGMDPEVPSTGVASATIFAFPEGREAQPFQAGVRLCHADFFSMFQAPFAHGGGWSRDVDLSLEQVAVLSYEGNQRLFGGGDSVGRKVRLGEQSFTVLGVLAPWQPTPQYYDIINNAFGRPRDVFLPFDFIKDQALALSRVGDNDNWGPNVPRDDPEVFFMGTEMTWIQFWVELDPADRGQYHQAVDRYALTQKELGRFPRDLNNRVSPVMEWLAIRQVNPPGVDALVLVSMLFLLVCCLNLTGLLLAKFLAQSGVLGVHRAVGASKRSIFVQRLVECQLVASVGGLLGALLAGVILRVVDWGAPDFIIRPELFRLDLFTLAMAVGLALLAGLVSGLYPAWRACRIAPALQLKLQ
ncbi:MAG: ABC transporter permease [Acidobacteriota bacterium]